jgi:hypothetical protein
MKDRILVAATISGATQGQGGILQRQDAQSPYIDISAEL